MLNVNTASQVIAIVGRPNVGKSTLFNALTKSRAALVADMPGVTRDRQYGIAEWQGQTCAVVDTGGFVMQDTAEEKTPINTLVNQQTMLAIEEADQVLWLLDSRSGVTVVDELLAEKLRSYQHKIHLVVNKIDHEDIETAVSEFFSLGFGRPIGIAARQRRGLADLCAYLFVNEADGEHTAVASLQPERNDHRAKKPTDAIYVAVIGRPNVGKSTLINRLLGSERVIVADQAGTTRDSIFVPLLHYKKKYVLIDTAGVRRRSRVYHTVEKFSVVKTLKAMQLAHVNVVVLNAREGISEQDVRLVGLAVQSGKSLVVVVNQCDNLLTADKKKVRKEIERRLAFAHFAHYLFISALYANNRCVSKLFSAIQRTYQAVQVTATTAQLTRLLLQAVQLHQPPLVRGRRIRLRYAHWGERNPMRIIVHGKQVDELPASYGRYLAHYFREQLKLEGVPLLVHFKNDHNPYV